MTWTLDDAQQHFQEIITAVRHHTPQLIYHQNHPIVAIISADLFQEFLAWQTQQAKPQSLSQALAELRQLCSEEDYSLEVPLRQNRPDPFLP
ncbi:type II toxin-antitoxin system Phd/YefM family antitoxin [Prochlorothrix hollandica]|uniref:Antitoxin n=1 Tax=Prochlorothrix hollandica PCC 9006 = CALU 1027 TaxID=317619 RepID=A0A0M2PS53_PROHO|nr:type II toxin-antitoxin system Phd/YefM family antitoxin [Prochlorothrix hollandica]KKI97992.1 hypothetical protein PROH_19720 [Prochlorothrix hollandica PCC 9006 = CALU 1027]